MMNIVLVDGELNKNEIRAKAPSIYVKKFDDENEDLKSTLATHFIGNPDERGIYTDQYEVFVKKRAKRIAKALNRILDPFSGSKSNRGRRARS